jgi:ATP-dependent HslUV protease ATP-binding subunit HslU
MNENSDLRGPAAAAAGEAAIKGAAAFTPREIVSELDRYIVGQDEAKRAVAIALRNRWRRQQLPDDLREEVLPKNILMIGPTGVGKTEISRRLARLANAPFIKVEATKFTEVGYVGRDVDTIVRDLVENAIGMVRREREEEVRVRAGEAAEERLLDLLLPQPQPQAQAPRTAAEDPAAPPKPPLSTREKLREQLRAGVLDSRMVEVEAREEAPAPFQVLGVQGGEDIEGQLRDMLPGLFGAGKKTQRKATVAEAREVLLKEEQGRLVDRAAVVREAIVRVESRAIVFLDEIDKIAGRERGVGPDVSREGVQRDLLPIVEGTTVNTKHGPVRTDHVLFIAAGAFHVSKPSDLIPELQGRFPIRVELTALSEADLVRILTEPKNALTAQYRALLEADGVELVFTEDAVRELARAATVANQQTENIGARRLATVLETVLEETSFSAGEGGPRRVTIDAPDVRERLARLLQDRDLTRFIL